MEKISKLGRWFFAIAIVAFGIQHFIYAVFLKGIGPPWFPGRPLWACLSGVVLTATGGAILFGKKAPWAATLLGAMMLLLFLLLHMPRVAANLRDADKRTSAFEVLAMCGVALVLAGTLSDEQPGFQGWDNARDNAAKLGRAFFAISMVVFGVDHFLFARFVAGLVPSWIPAHLFWVYLTGAGFIAAAVSIMVNRYVSLLASLLGLMFLLWVLLLHAPRVVAALHNANEWTSAFVALAMCGGAFIVAGTLPGSKRKRSSGCGQTRPNSQAARTA